MRTLRRPHDVVSEYKFIDVGNRHMRLLIVRPKGKSKLSKSPGVLWLHGGGYLTGFPEMVYMSRAIDLVRKCGAVVVAPAYTLSFRAPYPAGLRDCHKALVYMRDNADRLGIDSAQLMVGGESAGGGLTAALCMYEKDNGGVKIAFQMPLYPMLDCFDTDSSKNNHEKVWNTPKNHIAWRIYLSGLGRSERVPCYASPARRKDYSGLPPCYTFVGNIEPFFVETLQYVRNLRMAGVEAKMDIYRDFYHAYDMMQPSSKRSKQAADRFCAAFNEARKKYFAPQE